MVPDLTDALTLVLAQLATTMACRKYGFALRLCTTSAEMMPQKKSMLGLRRVLMLKQTLAPNKPLYLLSNSHSNHK